MNDITDFSEVITRVFSNIERSDLEEANKLVSGWKEVCKGIKNYKDEYYGERIAEHSKVIDIKDGMLLIETDHPGWTQILQLHSNFILKGLKFKFPELKIDSLAFRLRGSDADLGVSSAEHMANERKKFDERLRREEEKLDAFYKKQDSKNQKNSNNSAEKTELPPELAAKFESLYKSMLTNSKK